MLQDYERERETQSYYKIASGFYLCTRVRIESLHLEKGINYRRSNFPPVTTGMTLTSDDLQSMSNANPFVKGTRCSIALHYLECIKS